MTVGPALVAGPFMMPGRVIEPTNVRFVIASPPQEGVAIHALDCFVATLLAMTGFGL
jgi:hypothetical protein